MEKQQEATMRQVGGSAHGGLKYLTQEEYDILKKDEKAKGNILSDRSGGGCK